MAYIVRQQAPRLGFRQPEPVGWTAQMHGFGEPGSVYAERVGFGFNKADLLPAHRAEVDLLARTILATDTRRVQLVGQTDPVGTPQYKKALGQCRADVVRMVA